jgi:hypothetical protein
MRIRDLIDKLISLEVGTTPDEEVTIDVEIPGRAGWFGCLIDRLEEDENGIVIKAVAP